MLKNILPTVAAGDVWLGDRAYCTTEFLGGIHERKAYFLVRQHATALEKKELLGNRREVGRCSTGLVHEQALQALYRGEPLALRRITIELDQPTTDGDTEIHLVTNLTESAITLADLYLERWTIENAFQELGQSLQGEIRTLCYPKAALLAFCIAVYTYNLISALKAAIRVAHAQEDLALADISTYYLAEELSAIGGGLAIAVDSTWWQAQYGSLTAKQMSQRLIDLAKRLNPKRFRKRVRKTRSPPLKRTGDYRDHLSAARILANRLA